MIPPSACYNSCLRIPVFTQSACYNSCLRTPVLPANTSLDSVCLSQQLLANTSLDSCSNSHSRSYQIKFTFLFPSFGFVCFWTEAVRVTLSRLTGVEPTQAAFRYVFYVTSCQSAATKALGQFARFECCACLSKQLRDAVAWEDVRLIASLI